MTRPIRYGLLVAAVLPWAMAAAGWGLAQSAEKGPGKAPGPIAPAVTLLDAAASDQDDMCIWIHPTHPADSTVIASDKAAGKLLVYDLAGKAIQVLPAGKPGNIDLRYGFPLGGRKVDVLAFNERGDDAIWVYAVDPATRRIARVDDGAIKAESNYGGTLYRSPKTGKLYFLTTSTRARQYELFDNGQGKVSGKLVREWKIDLSEGAVGDDESGRIYYAEESRGVVEVGGEPDDPTPGKLIARVGENGLVSDVEGLAIYHLGGGKGYLLVSSQGNDQFKVYRREGAHEYLGTFGIRGARDTDGVDVANVALGEAFPKGLFACHTDRSPACPVLLTRWEDIAAGFAPPLAVDTSWNPRAAGR